MELNTNRPSQMNKFFIKEKKQQWYDCIALILFFLVSKILSILHKIRITKNNLIGIRCRKLQITWQAATITFMYNVQSDFQAIT